MKTDDELFEIIDTILYDQIQEIKNYDGSIAEYLIDEAKTSDDGYYKYLNEDEIKTFRKSIKEKNRLKEEIKTFISENFNYYMD